MKLLLRKSPKIVIGAVAIAFLLWTGTATAQETPAMGPAAAPSTTPAPASASPSNGSAGQQLHPGDKANDAKNANALGQTTFNQHRLFGVLPNYSTVESAEQLKPLTVKEKYRLSWDALTDKV